MKPLNINNSHVENLWNLMVNMFRDDDDFLKGTLAALDEMDATGISDETKIIALVRALYDKLTLC